MGSDMFFLMRTAFWLTLVLVLIPLGSDENSTQVDTVNPVSAYLAAQATVSDIGSFCSRNPDACETGGDALSAIGSRARDGARIVYQFLDQQVANDSGRETIVTGSTATPNSTTPQRPVVVSSTSQPVFEALTRLDTEIGPVPRPKPRSGA
ncbi:hypothetical protein FIV00_13855 [Labrenzia sp. THAF82]|nr:hypothetical protein FIV00_13855 [Labrenzia sp. THAF82]